MNRLVGITIGVSNPNESLWVNGIKLNAAMLYMLINKIEGYEAVLVNTSNKINNNDISFWDLSKFKTKSFTEIAKDLDVLIFVGTAFKDEDIKSLKKQGLKSKIVKYNCGNNYIIDMERVLFQGIDSPMTEWSESIDQVWYIPQQEKLNKDIYSISSRTSAKVVPFIWDPYFIDNDVALLEKKGNIVKYQNLNSLKKIVSLEPNINIVKYALPIIFICEECIRKGCNFDNLTICSGEKMFKHVSFRKNLEKLDIFKQNKIKYVGRYPIAGFLSNNADIIISNQLENPLNYLYLDAVYLEYPLLHNAWMVQDVGYYYKDFNLIDAADILKWIIENHDSHIDSYNIKNKKALFRYTKENQDIVDTYKMLLDNLFNLENKFKIYEYDWKINNYKK